MATDIELDVEILKKEVSDMKEIHSRLDTAITKITEVSNCINRMLAVHEEKISQQEDVQNKQQTDIDSNVKELHSRINALNPKLVIDAGCANNIHKDKSSTIVKFFII